LDFLLLLHAECSTQSVQVKVLHMIQDMSLTLTLGLRLSPWLHDWYCLDEDMFV